MFGVALGIRPREFTNVIQKPKALLAGLTAQIFLLPALTFLIITLLHQYITPTVAMGMILVAACPGGNISNFISSLAKGKVELSVTMTAFTTLGAILTTPFNFAFLGWFVRTFSGQTFHRTAATHRNRFHSDVSNGIYPLGHSLDSRTPLHPLFAGHFQKNGTLAATLFDRIVSFNDCCSLLQ